MDNIEETVSEDFFDTKENITPCEELSEIEVNESKEIDEAAEYKRPAFAFWNVGNDTFKLKLKSANITELEKKYNTSLLSLLGSDAGLPKLSVMLDLTYAAMQPWYHGVKYESIVGLYDKYIEAGGSQLEFYKSVYMDIYKASGFFTKEMILSMNKNLK